MKIGDVISLCLGLILGSIFFVNLIEPMLPNSDKELIEAYEQNRVVSDSLIVILEAENDSLRITRTEFDYAVKLLEENK